MNFKTILFCVSVILLGSCTTAYRSGQTPDDVYYSPAPSHDDYVRVNTDADRNKYNYNDESLQDRSLRMQIQNPRFRTYIDAYSYYPYDNYIFGSYYSPSNYFNSPYYYGSHGVYGFNYYDPYFSSYYYNPYYTPIFVSPNSGKAPLLRYSPRQGNLGVYGQGYNNTGTRSNVTTTNNGAPARTFTPNSNSNNNNGTGVGNVIRRIFSGNSERTNNYDNTRTRSTDQSTNNNTPSRTFEPSRTPSTNNSSSTPSNSSGNSNNAPVRTFNSPR